MKKGHFSAPSGYALICSSFALTLATDIEDDINYAKDVNTIIRTRYENIYDFSVTNYIGYFTNSLTNFELKLIADACRTCRTKTLKSIYDFYSLLRDMYGKANYS